jgi:L-alanine-DL-glutamate epimerase-like enolase superfamily enzyme
MNAPESFTTAPHWRAEKKPTDVRITAVELYLLPVATRLPLKFGAETLTTVTCARVRMTVVNRRGETAIGWGETPLSVPWVWPSSLSYAARDRALQEFCRRLAAAWAELPMFGHAMEIGDEFLRGGLTPLLHQFNRESPQGEPMPHLAGLVCSSAFDIALHDAYGQAAGMPVYETYNSRYMNRDLSTYLESDADNVDFRGKYPADYLRQMRPQRLPVWHLVGGLDALEASELSGDEPNDGYPTLLRDWIAADGLKCLKVKLRGNDSEWDFQRMVRVGRIAAECGVEDLTADFNCMVSDPRYVTDILDRLKREQPHIYDKILYVEQPFPYDLEANRIDVHIVSQRKPLLMDESAHDWRLVRLGRSLGWNGVALKTCKTQTGALLTLSWAAAHGLHLMVQDLTNPMLAQIPHVLLAAHADTMRGVESNAMQFYPDASRAEAAVHPGLYRRRGELDLSTIAGPGFGYRIDEIRRPLPEPVVRCESSWGD